MLAAMGWSLFFLRRFEEAIPRLKEATQLRPGNIGPLQALSAAYAHLGRLAEARDAYQRLPAVEHDPMFNIYRNPDHRALIRSGLAIAAAAV